VQENTMPVLLGDDWRDVSMLSFSRLGRMLCYKGLNGDRFECASPIPPHPSDSNRFYCGMIRMANATNQEWLYCINNIQSVNDLKRNPDNYYSENNAFSVKPTQKLVFPMSKATLSC